MDNFGKSLPEELLYHKGQCLGADEAASTGARSKPAAAPWTKVVFVGHDGEHQLLPRMVRLVFMECLCTAQFENSDEVAVDGFSKGDEEER